MAKIRNEVDRLVTYQQLPSGGRRKRTWVREADNRVVYQDGHDYQFADGKWAVTYRHPDFSWHVWGEHKEHDNGVTLTTTVTPTRMSLAELRKILEQLRWYNWE
jgi:hypothetical protein